MRNVNWFQLGTLPKLKYHNTRCKSRYCCIGYRSVIGFKFGIFGDLMRQNIGSNHA